MKKALATILALVMALALCSVSWATDPAATPVTETTTELDSGAYIVNGEVTLTGGALTVKPGATVTLELAAGSKLTNKAGSHTIINNGTLTITGTGTVDNVSHGCGALVNKVGATATLNGGKFTRSAEKGTKDGSNGNSWYAIKNYGTMEINSGVTVEANGGYSSLIANGWQNATDLQNNPQSTFQGNLPAVQWHEVFYSQTFVHRGFLRLFDNNKGVRAAHCALH